MCLEHLPRKGPHNRRPMNPHSLSLNVAMLPFRATMPEAGVVGQASKKNSADPIECERA